MQPKLHFFNSLLDMYTNGSILTVYMKALSPFESTLLNGWEDVFKRSQLTLWILLAIKDSPKHMQEIKDFIDNATHGTITADDKSMYRALRRYSDGDILSFTNEPGNGGPDRKLYHLTVTGNAVLAAFLRGNIISVLYQPHIKALIERSTK